MHGKRNYIYSRIKELQADFGKSAYNSNCVDKIILALVGFDNV